MRHISYTSMANELTQDEFSGILAHARQANEERQICGAIAFDGRMITQILQGPATEVDELYLRIQSDRRHTGVVLQSRADIDASQFEGFGLTRMTPSDLFMIAMTIEERYGAGDSSAVPLFGRVS
ncbi:BLUF domain-containing protein [Jiella sp. MQZ9-1]|uniref:BLUF domain-containing protein n=1 Tax=Jiella flava TaxID=2816857 RepID=A0A939FZ45_9HYPH|nr:BLUF domain-containing protein [Jiella flava]MBO0663504.1 BLUF domain-containing protein [Jiella flava]MCD2472079.1 BLUF domain-containing protein [Jiella flava]